MSTRRPFAAWLFTLALLLGQAAAFAHALTHLHAHEPGLPDKVCELCVAQAQLGSAIPPATLALPVTRPAAALATAAAHPRPDPASIIARARAPPGYSA
jgi:hypothetical protein